MRNSLRWTCALSALALLAPASFSRAGGDDADVPFSKAGRFVFAATFTHRDGATLYRAICQGCHMADAKGAEGAGKYPALAGNPKLISANYPALTVLKGRHAMPAFAGALDDEQVAEVVNYVRTHFGNQYSDALTAADVAKLR